MLFKAVSMFPDISPVNFSHIHCPTRKAFKLYMVVRPGLDMDFKVMYL